MIDSKEGKALVERTVFDFLGECGVSESNFKILFAFEGKWVAKCYLKSVDKVIAGLALKVKSQGKPVVVRVVKISGTLKSLLS